MVKAPDRFTDNLYCSTGIGILFYFIVAKVLSASTFFIFVFVVNCFDQVERAGVDFFSLSQGILGLFTHFGRKVAILDFFESTVKNIIFSKFWDFFNVWNILKKFF